MITGYCRHCDKMTMAALTVVVGAESTVEQVNAAIPMIQCIYHGII